MFRQILVSLFFVLVAQATQSQFGSVDSLRGVINVNQSDTAVVKAYLHWGSNMYRTDIDSALLLWGISRDLGVKAREKVERGSEEDVHLSMSISSALNNSAYLIAYRGDTASAIQMHRQALQLSEGAKDTNGVAYVYNNLALLYSRFGEFYKSIEYHKKAIEIRRQLNDSSGLAGSLGSIGVAYEKLGNARLSLHYHSKALEIHEALGNTDGVAMVYSNMGVVFNQQGELEKSRTYYQRSFDLRDSIGNKRGAMHSLANLGAAYLSEKNYSKAISIFKECLVRLREVPEPGLKGNVYLNLGNVFENTNELDSAKKYYHLSLEEHEASMLKHGSVYSYINLTSVYLALNDVNKARNYGEKGLELATSINLLDGKQKVAEQLAKVYERQSDWELAHQTYQLFIETRDSLKRKENQKAAILQEANYQFRQKELSDSIQKANDDAINKLQMEKLDAEIAEQEVINMALLIGAALLVGFTVVLLVTNNRRRKLNKLLSAQKNEIAAKNDEKELLLKEIHHRVKNNLQIITGLLELQSIELDSDEFASAMLEGQNRVKSMALIHEKLYQVDELATIEMNGYIEQLSRELASAYSKNHNLNLKIDCEEIQLDIDTAIPIGLILNELITNSWKYAFKTNEAELNIQLKRTDPGNYLLVYSDNGGGLPDEVDFRSSKTLGMRLIKRLTQQLFGTVIYDRELNEFRFNFKDNSYKDQIR